MWVYPVLSTRYIHRLFKYNLFLNDLKSLKNKHKQISYLISRR